MSDKNCLICVYNEVCKDRKRDETITDCCVPELPLREKQRVAWKQGGISLYIAVTHEYVTAIKAKSKYWNKEKLDN